MTHPCLVADVGGTNTRLALIRNNKIDTESLRKQRNAGYEGLEPVLTDYLSELNVPQCAGAAVAMAGPVADGAGQLTNLGWSLSRKTLANCCGVADPGRSFILNDLQAQGLALDLLDEQDLLALTRHARPPSVDATKLVIGIGTGFNSAAVFHTGTLPQVPPAESGHAGLPVQNETDLEFASFLTRRVGFAAIEDALSGRGLENCDRFIGRITGHFIGLSQGQTTGRSSTEILNALAQDDPQAVESFSPFTRILARVCGDLALTHLPTGGIVLAGGLARAAAPFLINAGFLDHFENKGRFSEYMQKFPISILDNDYAALIGAARLLTTPSGPVQGT